jgi:hypothetical protein
MRRLQVFNFNFDFDVAFLGGTGKLSVLTQIFIYVETLFSDV